MSDSIVVIQCAGGKRAEAGYLQSGDGRKAMLVAQPDLAPANGNYTYARPDDHTNTDSTWRQELLRYNREQAAENPLGLLPAWQLYKPRGYQAYKRLHDICGPENLYILSAGWGLIPADFLTPCYDITFSNAGNVEKHKRRNKRDAYADFCMLPDDTAKSVVFFGGKDYVGLFCKLTGRVQGPRHVFYNANVAPKAPGCQTRKFHTNIKTNWHYAAAQAYVEGQINI